MPTFQGFDAFAKALDRSVVDLSTTEKRKITRDLGRKAEQIAQAQARADLGGDNAMSGWPRAALHTKLKTDVKGATVLLPRSKIAAAGWTTATVGRNQGNATGFQGPGVNRSTGLTARTKSGNVRKVRARKAKRWNGTTSGKGTADKARARMESEIPQIAGEGVKKALRKRFDVT